MSQPGPTSPPPGPRSSPPDGAPTVPGYGSYPEARRIGEILRKETVGGILLVIAAAVALILANSPAADGYFVLRDLRVGYEPWHLELSLGAWAADGLLAIFFFLVGLELKREVVAGDLRDPRRAVVPVVAAIGGVVVPAGIYAVLNMGNEAVRGWAIPTATDIAFAVAVLAIVGSHLPSALRIFLLSIFLLTLAVVDDLIAITIIAVLYTEDLQVTPLLRSLVPLAAYWFLARRYSSVLGLHRSAVWVVLLPIGLVVWALVHASGIHATIAGVLLRFAVPVVRSVKGGGPTAGPGLAVRSGVPVGALTRTAGLALDAARRSARRGQSGPPGPRAAVGGPRGRRPAGRHRVHGVAAQPTSASRSAHPATTTPRWASSRHRSPRPCSRR